MSHRHHHVDARPVRRIQEQCGHGTAAKPGDHKNRSGDDNAQYRAVLDPLVNPIQLPRAQILSGEGSGGGSHGVKGADKEHAHPAARRDGRHGGRAQTVDRGLQQNAADGGDGILQAHGQAHIQQLPDVDFPKTQIVLLQMENREFLHDEIQAQHTGNQLAQQRRPACARDAHIQRQNKHDVQRHVQQAAHNQEHQRRFGISQRPENARQEIVQHGRGDAQKNHENIVVSIGKRIRRGVHPKEDLAAQQRRDQRHRCGDDAAEPDHITDEPAQPVKIPLSEFLRHGNGKPGAHAVAQSQHQKRNRTGRADPRQRVHTQKFPHHNGIHHTVNLLKQQSENQRQHKGKYQLHRRPGGQVLRMHICQVCHLIFAFCTVFYIDFCAKSI